MRWKVITPDKEYIVSATSSREAVKKITDKGKGPVTGAKLMPKNTVDKVKSQWRKWFN
jgi:hypothetical protein